MSVRALIMAAATPPLPPVGPTTWDPAYKAATIALTNGNLTATGSGSTYQVTRSTTSHAGGKVYWEITLTTQTSTLRNGAGNANVLTSTTIAAVLDAFGFGNTQQTRLNSSNLNSGSTASSSGDVISFAFDITNKLLWVSSPVMRAASTPWNNSGTSNPSTNTLGASLAGLNPGPYYAMADLFEAGGSVIANFGASAFTIAVPTGFTAWNLAP
jgi:hypothetical protein